MKKATILCCLGLLAFWCVVVGGCGSEERTLVLVLNKPIPSGQASITVKEVRTAKELETIKPKNGNFLLITYDLKNNSGKNVLVLEPKVRTEDGEYMESKSAGLDSNYFFQVSLKNKNDFMGGDLKAEELRKGIISVYDVPNGVLELGIAKSSFEGYYREAIVNHGTTKGSIKLAFYKLTPALTTVGN